MIEIDWTNVILGVFTLLGGCGWVIDRKKHRQDGKLRNEVKDLRNAIEGVYDCPYRNECPVRERMRQQPPSGCEPVGRTTD